MLPAQAAPYVFRLWPPPSLHVRRRSHWHFDPRPPKPSIACFSRHAARSQRAISHRRQPSSRRYAAHEPDVLSTPYLVNAFYTARPDALAATWRTAKGPIAAAHLALTRLGCCWPAPFEIADHEGSVYNMFHVLPKTMRHLLHRATLDRLAEQLAGSPPTRRVLDEPVRKLLRSSSLTPQQKGIVATVFCGGV